MKDFVESYNLKTLYVENLKQLRFKSKLSRKELNKQQYFTYGQVLNLLEQFSQEKGFQLIKVNPAYTSQTCSCCGEIDKSNRKGEIYQCKSCSMEKDADWNASINILHRGVYSPSTTEELKE